MAGFTWFNEISWKLNRSLFSRTSCTDSAEWLPLVGKRTCPFSVLPFVRLSADTRTNRQSGECVTSGGSNFNDLPDNQQTKFRVFTGWSRTFIPLNFYEKSCSVPPIGWKPLTDTTNKRTIGQRDVSVYPIRWSLTLTISMIVRRMLRRVLVDMAAKMSQSGCCRSLNATARWWFSSTDSSL